MTDDFMPKPANSAATLSVSSGPSLTDAEVNRQMGRGEVPHPVELGAIPPDMDRGPPLPDMNAPGAPLGVQVGARSVARPTARLDETASGEGTMYDRLAKADNVPSKAGGSSLMG